LAAYAHEPGLRLQNEIVAGKAGFRPRRAVAADRAADDARRVLLQPVVAEAPFLQRAELEVLHQDVTLADELGQYVLTRFYRHIERDRALVAVQSKKVRGLTFEK